MSKNVEKVSAEERAAPESTSVFDFIYHDARRIASFLSQFDDNGHLTSIKQTESVSVGVTRGKSFGISGSVPALGGAGIQAQISPGEKGREGFERAYDPIWANALELLSALTVKGMIQRDLQNARIGQFVLASGSLSFTDLNLFQTMWKIPIFQELISKGMMPPAENEGLNTAGGNRHERRKNQGRSRANQSKPEIPMELAAVMEFLPLMPHGGRMTLITNDGFNALWAPVSEGCMVSPISDVMLKHGQKMAGEWQVLGILDAAPSDQFSLMTPIEMAISAGSGSALGPVALALIEPMREIFGRPPLAYGITPLLAFREVF
jgi:hypothetical protein